MKSRSKTKKGSLLLAVALGLSAALAAPDADAFRNTIVQDLMKRLNGYSSAGNTQAAAVVLNLVKAMGPDEYTGWEAIAEKGRAAAASGDSVAMKASCTKCHDQYRAQYKSKYGSGARDDKGPLPRED